MGLIKREVIDKVLDAADIVDVVRHFIPDLKQAGKSFIAKSPWNDEKTPSFSVSPERKIFNDFSSGKKGGVIVFLREFPETKMTFPEAIKWLANRYGIAVENEKPPALTIKRSSTGDTEVDRIYNLLSFAKEHFKARLWNQGKRSKGLDYLEFLGFKDELIQSMEIGYAVQAWDDFAKAGKSYLLEDTEGEGEGWHDILKAGKRKGFANQEMEQAGLLNYSKTSQKYYDTFRGRVMFPFYDLQGRVIGFGARILERKSKEEAKYLNSRDISVHQRDLKVKIFSKEAILYGIFHAKDTIRKEGEAYMLEGYTDVLALIQSGLHNSISSSGTALTQKHVSLIKQFTSTVILVYDGDTAGIKAANRGVDILLSGEIDVKIVVLPDGQDPHEFMLKNGEEELVKFLKERRLDFVHFKVQTLLVGQTDPVKKEKAIKSIVRTVGYIQSPILRGVYLSDIAKMTGVPIDLLSQELAIYDAKRKQVLEEFQKRINRNTKTKPDAPTSFLFSALSPAHQQELELVKLLLRHLRQRINDIPFIDIAIEEIQKNVIRFTEPMLTSIFALCVRARDEKQFPILDWFKGIDKNVSIAANEIIYPPFTIRELSPGPLTPVQTIGRVTNELKRKLLEVKVKEILQKMETVLRNSTEEEKYAKIHTSLNITLREHTKGRK